MKVNEEDGTSNNTRNGKGEVNENVNYGTHDESDEHQVKEKCKICLREFDSLSFMQSHYEIHKKSLTLQEICEFTY